MKLKPRMKFQFVESEPWQYIAPDFFGQARFVVRSDGILDLSESPVEKVAVVR